MGAALTWPSTGEGCPLAATAVTSSPKQVRVFTFSVGQHNYDVTPLQWMACTNKGTLSGCHCHRACLPCSANPLGWLSTCPSYVQLSSCLFIQCLSFCICDWSSLYVANLSI